MKVDFLLTPGNCEKNESVLAHRKVFKSTVTRHVNIVMTRWDTGVE